MTIIYIFIYTPEYIYYIMEYHYPRVRRYYLLDIIVYTYVQYTHTCIYAPAYTYVQYTRTTGIII